MNILAILVLSIIPADTDQLTIPQAEVNTVYNEDAGTARFTQVLLWDHQSGSKCLHVRHWFMQDKLIGVYKTDDKNYPYRLVFRVDETRPYVTVKVKRVRRTHTFDDPEENDRYDFPVEIRTKI